MELAPLARPATMIATGNSPRSAKKIETLGFSSASAGGASSASAAARAASSSLVEAALHVGLAQRAHADHGVERVEDLPSNGFAIGAAIRRMWLRGGGTRAWVARARASNARMTLCQHGCAPFV